VSEIVEVELLIGGNVKRERENEGKMERDERRLRGVVRREESKA